VVFVIQRPVFGGTGECCMRVLAEMRPVKFSESRKKEILCEMSEENREMNTKAFKDITIP